MTVPTLAPGDVRLDGLVERINYRALADVAEDRPPYLIEGWLSEVATSLAGEPKAGKTTLTAAAVAALLRGDTDFIGLRVNRQIARAAFGLTDAGAAVELKRRFSGLGFDDRVRVFDPRALENDEWRELGEWLAFEGIGLYVHDNIVTGLRPGEDIAEPRTANEIVNRLRELEMRQIPILALTHPAKAGKEGFGVASSPMGGRAFGAWPRSLSYLKRPKGSRGPTLEIRSNMGPDVVIPLVVSFRGDVPVFARDRESRGDEPKKRRPRDAKAAVWDEAINRALAEQPANSVNGLCQWMAREYPALGAAETIRSKLKNKDMAPVALDAEKRLVRANDR